MRVQVLVHAKNGTDVCKARNGAVSRAAVCDRVGKLYRCSVRGGARRDGADVQRHIVAPRNCVCGACITCHHRVSAGPRRVVSSSCAALAVHRESWARVNGSWSVILWARKCRSVLQRLLLWPLRAQTERRPVLHGLCNVSSVVCWPWQHLIGACALCWYSFWHAVRWASACAFLCVVLAGSRAGAAIWLRRVTTGGWHRVSGTCGALDVSVLSRPR